MRLSFTRLKYAGAWILLFVFMASTHAQAVQSHSTSRTKKSSHATEELLLGGVRIIETQGGVSLTLKLISTQHKDRIPRKALLAHLSISPALPITLTPRPEGVLISGNFRSGSVYQIRLKKGLKSLKGAILKRNVVTSVKIPQPTPHLSFLLKGRYVGRQGDLTLPVRMVHVQKTFLTLCRVPARNLPLWEAYSRWERRNLEAVLIRKTPVMLKPVGKDLYMLNLASFLPQNTFGLYRIELSGCREKKPHHCSRDDIFLVVTDLGLIVKTTPKRVYTWVIHLTDGHPLAGVKVQGFSRRNLKIGEGLTNKRGVCSFPYNREATGQPFVILATYGNDTSYLPLQFTRISTALFHVGGRNTALPFLTTFIPEKDLYRPGETLHYAVILRDLTTFRGVSIPIIVRFRDPRGRVLITQHALTDSLGTADFSLSIPSGSLTGLYNLELVLGGKVLRTQRIFVEAFVPERLKVTLEPSHSLFTHWKDVKIALKARYLFGAPVSGGGFQVSWRLRAQPHGFYQDYHFGPIRLPGEIAPALLSWQERGKLNNEGHALLTPHTTPSMGRKAPWLLNIAAFVKEVGSERVTRQEISIPLRLAPLYPGLRITTLSPCRQALVDGVVISPEGHILERDLTLRYALYRIDTHYALTYSPQGNRRWERTVTRVPLTSGRPLQVSRGHFRIPVDIKTCWHDFLVAVWDPQGGARTELRIPGWRGKKNRPASPEILKITLSTIETAPGKKIIARTALPFPGRVLWTLEQDDVISFHWEQTKTKEASFSFTAPPGHTTLYVTAYLYQTAPGYLVTRAFGINRLRVVPAKVRIPVEVSTPAKIRPGQTLHVKIKGPPGGKAIVSVVDEGVLQITRFHPPDIYALLLAPLRLNVSTSEGLGWVLPRFRLLPGGGAAYAIANRMAKPPNPRFYQSFTFWKVISIPAGGVVNIPIKIARYEGALQVMASVAGAQGFASSHTEVKVAADIVVQPTLPRLLRQGDQVQIPVFLTNTTSKSQQVTVRIKTKETEISQKISLAPEKSTTLSYTLHPNAFFGTWPVTIQATFPGGQWQDTYPIRLLPMLPRDLMSKTFQIHPGKPFPLVSQLKGWAPQNLNLSVMVASNPLFGGLRHVKQLMTYPYGCLEQTSSTLLALVHLLPFMKVLAPDQGDVARLQERIHAGIVRLINLQLGWGGFTFWPGEEDPDSWGSAYATFALLETRDAGFHVPPVVIDRAIQYLLELESTPWRNFVLARAKRFTPRTLTLKRSKRDTQESLLLKAGTLYEAGYPEMARRMLKLVSQAPATDKKHPSPFFSPLRLQAMKLYMAELITPKNPGNEKLARGLLIQLNNRQLRPYTTQELAWCLVALGRFAKSQSFSPVRASLSAQNGPLPAASSLDGILTWQLKTPGKALTLKLEKPQTAWVSLTVDGYRSAGFSPVGNRGIRITRTFLSMKGTKLQRIIPGDLVVLDISLTNTTPGPLKHLAVRIPMVAGLEVINPHLYHHRHPSWTRKHKIFRSRYVDIRDTEVRLFGNLPPGTFHAYLLMRATFRYAGQLPPPRAELMYQPWIYAIGTMKPLKIQ